MINDQLGYWFESGLEKVSSVVDGAGNYDAILGARINKPSYGSIEKSHGQIYWEDACELLRKKVVNYQVSVYDVDDSAKILAYGSTYNNRKEFDFLSSVLERNGCTEKVVNISDCGRNKELVASKQVEKARDTILSVAERFFSLRGYVTKSILHQTINYSLTFLSAIETLARSSGSVFVVANDHSPMPVAFAVVAKYLGLTTLYVQHAEVTEIFPRNDFDFSILRNQVSREVYETIAPLTGEAIYLSRKGNNLSEQKLLESRKLLRGEVSPSVVVYPSSVISKEELGVLLRALQDNRNLSGVKIKPHPAFRAVEIFAELGVDVLEGVPEYPHIAICGNSSVVIELLARGNLVYQYFRLDSVAEDYYGFVRKGLADSLKYENLQGRFWSGVDDAQSWGAALGEYLPNLDASFNLIERRREPLFIQNLLVSSGLLAHWNPDISKEFSFQRDLFYFTQSFQLLMRSGQDAFYGDLWVIKRLNAYFNSRDVRLGDIYSRVDPGICGSVLDFWLIVKRIEWTGYLPTDGIISTLLEYVYGYSGGESATKWLETKIFDVLIRYSTSSLLGDFLSRTRFFSLENTGINRRIAFLRFIHAGRADSEALLKHFDHKNVDLTPLERLKISVQCLLEESGELEFSNYQEVEHRFVAALPAIADEYKTAVIDVYDQVRDRVTLLDVKRNPDQAHQFLELIKDRLISGEGLSFIRLSDGEGYLFQEFSPYFTELDAQNRERHWWGQEVPESLRKELVNRAKSAVRNADVLGIPSIYRFLRDHSDASVSLGNSVQGRGLLSVLEGIRSLDQGNALYTDDKANLAVFNKIEVLREVAGLAKKVIVVSSGDPKSLRAAFGGCLDLHVIPIPTHNKTQTNDKYTSFEKPLPFVFHEVCDSVSNIAAPGDLVLVGAGVAGKAFMDMAKQKGAVGLDLGSAMDELLGAGIHSLH